MGRDEHDEFGSTERDVVLPRAEPGQCGELGEWGEALGPFWIDTTAPNNPTSVTSPSHTPSVASCDNTIDVTWSGGSDGNSGISGYSWLWDTFPATVPDTTLEGPGKNTTSLPLADGSSHYFHIRTRDKAGNWASGTVMGPLEIAATAQVGSSTWRIQPQRVGVDEREHGEYILGSSGGGVWRDQRVLVYVDDGAGQRAGRGAVTGTASASIEVGDGCGYFHVRAVDVSDKPGPTAYLGPFCIDTAAPTTRSR